MQIFLVVLCTTITLATLALAVAGVRWWTWSSILTQRVLVNLDDGPSLEGIVMHRRGRLITLAEVVIHHDGQQVRQDGTAVVERDRILWIQVAD